MMSSWNDNVNDANCKRIPNGASQLQAMRSGQFGNERASMHAMYVTTIVSFNGARQRSCAATIAAMTTMLTTAITACDADDDDPYRCAINQSAN